MESILQPSEPRYRVLHKLAAGGMAEIFVAERVEADATPTRVALKRVRPHLREDAAITGMLDDEIRLGRLCKHPNVVATLGSGEASDGHPFAVLEYVEGLDLARLRDAMIARRKRFSRAQAVHIAGEICKGLDHLHNLQDEAGTPLFVVHRDVTPPNVLLGSDGAIKLCDFGFTKSNADRTLTEPGMIKGKFSYLAPETANGEQPDLRADLFSVGIILWEMLAMDRLFHARTDYETVQLIQKAAVPALEAYDADVDEVLEEIVHKCLQRDPADRYPSAKALHNALAAYSDWQDLSCDIGALVREAMKQLPPPPPLPAKRRRKRRSAAAAGSGARDAK